MVAFNACRPIKWRNSSFFNMHHSEHNKVHHSQYRVSQMFVPLPINPPINECVCFYCHLTLFVRNKLIYKGFKSVRCVQSILHTPCIHLTHYTPLPRVLFGRMRWVLRHRDVEKFVGATDFSVPLCCNIALPWACCVAACGLCRWRGLRADCAGCVQVALVASYTE